MPSWITAVLEFLNDNAGAISAIATVVIAWFSIRTWRVSRDQADIARRQNEILREEHKLNTDPDAQMYWDNLDTIGDDVQIRLLMVNPGNVPLSVAEIRVYLDGEAHLESRSGFHIVNGGRDIATPFILSPGDQVNVKARIPQSEFDGMIFEDEFKYRGALRIIYYTGSKLESKSAWYPPRNG